MSPPAATNSGSRRNLSLDGLRGVAALIVVLHHIALATSPGINDGHAGGLIERFLLQTPGAVFIAGPEAVIVFFVLSGFVLAWPFVGGAKLRLASYYARRFLRLYVPVWGALALAAILHAAVARPHVVGATEWLDRHAIPMSVTEGVRQATLMFPPGGLAFDPVLWSLRWEVVFSALLPAVVAGLIVLDRRWRPVVALGCFAAVAWHGGDWATYLAPFVLGSVMAFEQERLIAAVRRVPLAPMVIGAIAVLGLSFRSWWHGGWLPDSIAQQVATRGIPVMVVAGACAAVLLPLVSARVARGLVTPPVRWAGARSYSLYLVHEPVLVTLAFAFGGRPSALLLFVVGVPAALAVTELFFRVVERPSHRLSRAAGRRLAGFRFRLRRTAPVEAPQST
jgi:peptidoglycan/LPS O-acetylase OafA/YrhL